MILLEAKEMEPELQKAWPSNVALLALKVIEVLAMMVPINPATLPVLVPERETEPCTTQKTLAALTLISVIELPA